VAQIRQDILDLRKGHQLVRYQTSRPPRPTAVTGPRGTNVNNSGQARGQRRRRPDDVILIQGKPAGQRRFSGGAGAGNRTRTVSLYQRSSHRLESSAPVRRFKRGFRGDCPAMCL
jgi:hypothetical protein